MSAAVSQPAGGGWLRTLLRREPHQVVRTAQGPYLMRWFVLPHNRFLNMYMQTIASSRLLNRCHRLHARKFVELRDSRYCAADLAAIEGLLLRKGSPA
jgi:hypothetical protein